MNRWNRPAYKILQNMYLEIITKEEVCEIDAYYDESWYGFKMRIYTSKYTHVCTTCI